MAETFVNVWDALEDGSETAANLKLRSELMVEITHIIRKNNWTQREAAKRCGVTQPRMSDLMQGKMAKFSLDALVNMATAMGSKVELLVHAG
jgi:predicted XRE-type DNA-binding protein